MYNGDTKCRKLDKCISIFSFAKTKETFSKKSTKVYSSQV